MYSCICIHIKKIKCFIFSLSVLRCDYIYLLTYLFIYMFRGYVFLTIIITPMKGDDLHFKLKMVRGGMDTKRSEITLNESFYLTPSFLSCQCHFFGQFVMEFLHHLQLL